MDAHPAGSLLSFLAAVPDPRRTFEWSHSPFLVVVQARSDGPIGLRGFEVPVGIKVYVFNCCGKMPSLRRAGLPGSFNLPKQLRRSPLPTWRTPLEQGLSPGVAALSGHYCAG
jgi:hypothetical protein